MKSISLPKLIEDEIDALVSFGYYPSKDILASDAIKFFFENKRELRINASIKMYFR